MHTIRPTSLFQQLPRTREYESRADLQASIDTSFANPSLKPYAHKQTLFRGIQGSVLPKAPAASNVTSGAAVVANTDVIIVPKVTVSGGWRTDKWLFFIVGSRFTLLHWYLGSNYNLDLSLVNHLELPFYFSK